jgi:uncharacterized protein YbcV (DUF1398 family)
VGIAAFLLRSVEMASFTLDQIKAANDKVKFGGSVADYVQEMLAMGVRTSDSFVADGKGVYCGEDGNTVVQEPRWEPTEVSPDASLDKLKEVIAGFNQGQYTFATFCKAVGEAGVLKWTTDFTTRKVTYVSLAGDAILTEDM